MNASNEPKKSESTAQLFLHFHAYYCKALLIEIWYRCPDVLGIFQFHQDVSVEIKEESERGDTGSDRSAKLGDSVDDLPPESEPSKIGTTSVNSDNNQINGDGNVGEGKDVGVGVTVDEDDKRKAYDPKEPFASTKLNLVEKQDLMSTLKNVQTVLLSDHHVKISNLRELLTEIRKAMLLKRSKQFLQVQSTNSQLNQKKKKDKKPKAQPAHLAQPLGFSPSSSEGDPASETGSRCSPGKPEECAQAESREDNKAVDAEDSESLTGINAEDAVLGKETNDKGEKQSEGNNECAAYGERLDDVGAVPASEMITKDLTTPERKRPVDLRYTTSDPSLELLTEEEERVLKELEQLEFKVCIRMTS